MEFEGALPLMSIAVVKAAHGHYWWCGESGARVGGAVVCSTGELRLSLSCDHSFNEHVDTLVLTKTDILLSERKNLEMKGK